MHILPCEQPKRIFNAYLRKFMYVPCGKCYTCTTRKGFLWSQRLQQESKCHKYSIFVTLTYNEENLPYTSFVDDNGFITFPTSSINTKFSYTYNDYNEFKDDDKSTALINARDCKVPVLNYSDVQKFFKRIRRKIDYEYKEENKEVPTFRYYCCGEYGPSTYRPHYHLIMWFDSSWLKERIERLLLDGWSKYDRSKRCTSPIGRLEWSFVKASACNYVAQYVNCISHLPKMLTFPAIRPFGFGSRRPPIGSLLQSTKEIQEIFNKGITKVSVPRRDGQVAVSMPHLSAFRNRLFPKCLRYQSLAPTFRVAVYSISSRFRERYEIETVKQYESYLRKKVNRLSKSSFIYDYIYDITEKLTDIKPLLRALNISSRVIAQAAIFGCTVRYYVSRIDNYYNNVEKERLKDWSQFQSDYSNKPYNNISELCWSDLDFMRQVFYNRENINKLTVEDYGIDSFSSRDLDYRNLQDYQEMSRLSYKIYKETTKTKKKNSYLMAHPELLTFKDI